MATCDKFTIWTWVWCLIVIVGIGNTRFFHFCSHLREWIQRMVPNRVWGIEMAIKHTAGQMKKSDTGNSGRRWFIHHMTRKIAICLFFSNLIKKIIKNKKIITLTFLSCMGKQGDLKYPKYIMWFDINLYQIIFKK